MNYIYFTESYIFIDLLLFHNLFQLLQQLKQAMKHQQQTDLSPVQLALSKTFNSRSK